MKKLSRDSMGECGSTSIERDFLWTTPHGDECGTTPPRSIPRDVPFRPAYEANEPYRRYTLPLIIAISCSPVHLGRAIIKSRGASKAYLKIRESVADSSALSKI